MVKITGDQNIPSALLDGYRGTLTEKQPDGTSRKRYPYRVPSMQEGGSNVKAKQIAQRARFKGAHERFRTLSVAEKQRWYAARPPWSSFLWYYNYFIMSDLSGNAAPQQGGVGVVKGIRYYEATMPTPGPSNVTVAISDVDPNKCVMMLYGNGYYDPGAGATPIYPFPVSIYTTHAVLKMPYQIDTQVQVGFTVIEYI